MPGTHAPARSAVGLLVRLCAMTWKVNKTEAEHNRWKKAKKPPAPASTSSRYGLLSVKPANKRKARQAERVLKHARADAKAEIARAAAATAAAAAGMAVDR